MDPLYNIVRHLEQQTEHSVWTAHISMLPAEDIYWLNSKMFIKLLVNAKYLMQCVEGVTKM